MFNIFKLASLLVSVALCLASFSDPKSCRRCSGTYEIVLERAVSKIEAKNYVIGTLKACATGSEMDLGEPTTPGCSLGICASWSWPITTWRWCGNGGLVSFNQARACTTSICGATHLKTSCNKSVVCHTTCYCNQCGC